MAKRLIEEMLTGRYSKEELEEIIDGAKLAKQTYKIVEDKIILAKKDNEKDTKLKALNNNISALQNKLLKTEKVFFSNFFINGILTCVFFSLAFAIKMPVLNFISAILALIGTTALAVSFPIYSNYCKKQNKKINQQKQAMADLLSDFCFTVDPNLSSKVYSDVLEKETLNENQIINENGLSL